MTEVDRQQTLQCCPLTFLTLVLWIFSISYLKKWFIFFCKAENFLLQANFCRLSTFKLKFIVTETLNGYIFPRNHVECVFLRHAVRTGRIHDYLTSLHDRREEGKGHTNNVFMYLRGATAGSTAIVFLTFRDLTILIKCAKFHVDGSMGFWFRTSKLRGLRVCDSLISRICQRYLQPGDNIDNFQWFQATSTVQSDCMKLKGGFTSATES